MIVSFVNCGSSFFAGFLIFSVLGFMAKQLGTDVGNVVASGQQKNCDPCSFCSVSENSSFCEILISVRLQFVGERACACVRAV